MLTITTYVYIIVSCNRKVRHHIFERVANFNYLGETLTSNNSEELKVQRRSIAANRSLLCLQKPNEFRTLITFDETQTNN